MSAHVLLLAMLTLAPWWDDYPTTVQTSDEALARAVNASTVLLGVADDPTWGPLATRYRYLGLREQSGELRRDGYAMLAYTEGFGTTCEYIASFERMPDGALQGYAEEPTTPQSLLNHWSWQLWQPRANAEIHWVGLPAYYDASPWCGPWVRTHPRYGAPAFRYPDGHEARGYLGDPANPSTHAIYDAGGSKDILGGLAATWDVNAAANADGASREGLVAVPTPAGTRYSGNLSVAKDPACPCWVEYEQASARMLADYGIDGTWTDNFSLWDSLGSRPLDNAFGEWSVYRFRQLLDAGLSREARATLLGEERHDVRAYLRAKLRRDMGGSDEDLSDPRWSDPRWLEDPVWMSYLLFKRDAAAEALRGYHDALVGAAREAGVPDFGVQGNDIPAWSFGVARPEYLEMVSTEFAPGWSLIGGSRGLGLAPRGRIAPVIRMARAHQRGRFVHVWYYLDGAFERYRGDPVFGRVLSWELLASHAMIQAQGEPRVAGTPETHREVTDYIGASKGEWGDRRPYARIALVYSPLSQLSRLSPGGVVGFDEQPHTFDLLGWGTMLSELHVQYDVLPEWALTLERLAPYRVLVCPSVAALDSPLNGLEAWIDRGGVLIVSGGAGGTERAAQVLEDVAHRRGPYGLRAGNGAIVRTPALGYRYFTGEGARDAAGSLGDLGRLLRREGVVTEDDAGVSEVSVFRSPTRDRLFVDLAALDWNPQTSTAPQPGEVRLTLRLEGDAPGALAAHVLRPGRAPAPVEVTRTRTGLRLGPVPLADYSSVVIDGWSLPGPP